MADDKTRDELRRQAQERGEDIPDAELWGGKRDEAVDERHRQAQERGEDIPDAELWGGKGSTDQGRDDS
ncbi:MAG TPA: hypothetical protein VL179_01440 [Mycobacterium sp.]|nr:hypothetical protein [Mycobacterium sp.]